MSSSKTKIYYKDVVEGAETTHILIDDLFAPKEKKHSSNVVDKKYETGIRDFNIDISNLFQSLAQKEDKENGMYVLANYVEPTHILVEYLGDNGEASYKDLSDIFYLKSATLIAEADKKAEALQELQAGMKDKYGPWLRIPGGVSGTIRLNAPKLSFYGLTYEATVWGIPTIYEDSGNQQVVGTFTFDNKEGVRISSHTFDVPKQLLPTSYRLELKPIDWYVANE